MKNESTAAAAPDAVTRKANIGILEASLEIAKAARSAARCELDDASRASSDALRAFTNKNPEPMFAGSLGDHAAFDRWYRSEKVTAWKADRADAVEAAHAVESLARRKLGAAESEVSRIAALLTVAKAEARAVSRASKGQPARVEGESVVLIAHAPNGEKVLVRKDAAQGRYTHAEIGRPSLESPWWAIRAVGATGSKTPTSAGGRIVPVVELPATGAWA